jgi:beta-lactam-binding protein with PASTA domain
VMGGGDPVAVGSSIMIGVAAGPQPKAAMRMSWDNSRAHLRNQKPTFTLIMLSPLLSKQGTSRINSSLGAATVP